MPHGNQLQQATTFIFSAFLNATEHKTGMFSSPLQKYSANLSVSIIFLCGQYIFVEFCSS